MKAGIGAANQQSLLPPSYDGYDYLATLPEPTHQMIISNISQQTGNVNQQEPGSVQFNSVSYTTTLASM